MLPAAQVTGIQTGLQGIADQPVKKKKKRKKASAGGNESTHLSKGTMEMTGTAVESTRAAIAAQQEAAESPSSPTRSRARASFESDSSASYVDTPDQAKTRVGAALARQPSLIDEAPEFEQTPERANTGRKVEALPPRTPLDTKRVAASPEPAPVAQAATATAPTQTFEPNGATVQRTSSLSPSRAAHFSPKPEYLGGIQHQPLGRSASPAKSALKHSPSSSIRTASPDVRFSAPSSEVGESGSSLSKKKSNRVSFDERPIIVSGLQTSRYASQSPERNYDMDEDLEDIMKPRPALPSFGSVRGRKEETATPIGTATTKPMGHSSDHMVGGILAQDFANKSTAHDPNMPLAPEVTSVEGTGYASDSESEYSEHPSYNQTPQLEKPDALDKEPETIAEAVAAFQTHEQVTNERQNGAAQKAVDEPLPIANDEPQLPQAVAAPPTIAVLPATPAAEEEKKELVMPGSFPGAWDEDVEAQPAPVAAKGTTPAAVEQTQAVPAETSRQTHNVPTALRIDDESDTESDTSSIWSDAEEDFPSGPGGFASLNAIVDSPQPAPAAGLVQSKHAPTADNAPPSPTAAHWDEATAYWRGLSEQKKKELEKQAMGKEAGLEESETESGSEEETSEEEDEELEKTRSRPSTPPQRQAKRQPQLESPIAFATSAAPAQSRVKQEPKLRSSMRRSTVSSDDGDDEAVPKMRKSMRNSMRETSTEKPRASGEHHFRNSMRGTQPVKPDPVRRHSSGLEESKYAASGRPAATKAAEVVQNGRPRSAGGAAPAKSAMKKSVAQAPPVPTLRRQDSDDSVSSFRRQRLSSPGGRMSMRMSMRGAPPVPAEPQRPQSPPEKKKGGLFRLRSLSPTGRRPQPDVQASQIRSSLRPGSSSANTPTLRKTEPEPPKKASRFKSPTRLGFGKSKTKVDDSPRSQPAPAMASPRHKSRISADSDDEDVPRTQFVSRFADSDDEPDSPQQLTKTLTPVRGIPRRDNDGDSTDLDDSDNERTKKIPPVPSMRDIDHAHGKKSPMTNGNKAPSILSAGSLRKGAGGGEVSGLNASKFAATPSSPTLAERPQHKRRLSWLGMGGSKKRSSSMPPPITSPPPSRGNDAAPAKPNLLRRSTPTGLPQISEDSNWPLPSPGGIGEDTRPSTADGPGTALKKGSLRPDVGKRRSTADYDGTGRVVTTIEGGAGAGDGSSVEGGRKRVGFNFESGEPVFSERTGKKKKFGGLRRMFGLHD